MENKSEKQDAMQLLKNELPTLKALMGLNARPGTDVETMALQELEYLKISAISKPDILSCIPVSIIAAVKSVLKKNLTLDPESGLVYIKTRNIALEKDSNGKVVKWGKILEIQESANGLISVNRQCGRILDLKRPEVEKDSNGKVIKVWVELLLPSYGGPRWEKREYDESDFKRWAIASHKENSRTWKEDSGKPKPDSEKLNYANPNYTSWQGGIDPEFARAKAIRHGLKKLGTNQNEVKMNGIIIQDAKNISIDPAKDQEAMYDEAQVVGAEAYITTHEVVTIPNTEL